MLVEIVDKNELSLINAAMKTMLGDVPFDDPDTQIVVGFDSEWNVGVSMGGRVHERGHTSVLQIAYKNGYIFFRSAPPKYFPLHLFFYRLACSKNVSRKCTKTLGKLF